MTVFGVCEKGNYRKENQDCILMRVQRDSGLFLVADGVGGSADGLGASFHIVDRYAQWWQEEFPVNMEEEFFPLFAGIKRLAGQINRELCRRYGAGSRCSTLTLLFIHKGIFGYLSVGDSRIYRCDWKGPRAITRDDVWENLPDAGYGLADTGKIVSAVGGYERLEYSCATDKVQPGEVFFLCTDGIYRYVDEEILLESLEWVYHSTLLKTNMEEILTRKIMVNDIRDNYSLIILKV